MCERPSNAVAASEVRLLCAFHRKVVRDAEINFQIAQEISLHRRRAGHTSQELAGLSGVPEPIVSCLEDIEHPADAELAASYQQGSALQN